MDPLGTFHVASAVLALVAGCVIVLQQKGGGVHRRWGWTYAGAMVALNLSALMLYRLTGTFGPFHVAALFSLLTIVAGLVPARQRGRGWMHRHAYWMAGSYVGLWAALAAELTTRVDGLPFWATAAWTSFAVFAVGAALVGRNVPHAMKTARIDRFVRR
jgi:uncharacterized membrane protein